jgi:hypothetical protein
LTVLREAVSRRDAKERGEVERSIMGESLSTMPISRTNVISEGEFQPGTNSTHSKRRREEDVQGEGEGENSNYSARIYDPRLDWGGGIDDFESEFR